MVEVIFQYDEVARKWNPIVSGTIDSDEARQAFNTVVLTCKQTNVAQRAFVQQVGDVFVIVPHK